MSASKSSIQLNPANWSIQYLVAVVTTDVCSARRRPQCLVPINDCYYLKPHTSTFTTPNSGDEPSGSLPKVSQRADEPRSKEASK